MADAVSIIQIGPLYVFTTPFVGSSMSAIPPDSEGVHFDLIFCEENTWFGIMISHDGGPRYAVPIKKGLQHVWDYLVKVEVVTGRMPEIIIRDVRQLIPAPAVDEPPTE